MLAAGRNDAQSVHVLLDAGADPDVVAQNGLTALGYAKENAQAETVELLQKASSH